MNWELAWHEKAEMDRFVTACWIKRNGKISGLFMPDLYGRDRELGLSDLMGKFTVDQILALRASLPVVSK